MYSLVVLHQNCKKPCMGWGFENIEKIDGLYENKENIHHQIWLVGWRMTLLVDPRLTIASSTHKLFLDEVFF